MRIVGGKVKLDKANETFQVNLEVIRHPCYRIVFWHKDESLMKELAERLKEKRWCYPPYLGILGFLADVEFELEDEAEKASEREVELNSALPLSASIPSMELNPLGNYIREERVPLDALPGRQFKYLDVVYIESTAQPLLLTAESIKHFCLKGSGLKVMFFEE
jgi:CRISPR-associated protein Cas5h